MKPPKAPGDSPAVPGAQSEESTHGAFQSADVSRVAIVEMPTIGAELLEEARSTTLRHRESRRR